MMRRCFRCMNMRPDGLMHTDRTCLNCFPPPPEGLTTHGVKSYRLGCRCPQCWRYRNRPDPEEKRAYLIEEVTHLLVFDVPVGEIAKRVGKTVSSLQRLMYRWGRPDLARPFERELQQLRAKKEAT